MEQKLKRLFKTVHREKPESSKSVRLSFFFPVRLLPFFFSLHLVYFGFSRKKNKMEKPCAKL